MLDPQPPGGAWHGMHEATKTLSPGTWMELPGYSLAAHLRSRCAGEAEAGWMASQRQPRSLIAGYYEAAAKALDVQQHHRPQRVVHVRWEPADTADAAAAAAAAAQSPPTTPGRAAPTKAPPMTPAMADGVWVVEAEDASSTARHQYRAHALLLAIGTSGRPRRLGIEVRRRRRQATATTLAGARARSALLLTSVVCVCVCLCRARRCHSCTTVASSPPLARKRCWSSARVSLQRRLHRLPLATWPSRAPCLPRSRGGDQSGQQIRRGRGVGLLPRVLYYQLTTAMTEAQSGARQGARAKGVEAAPTPLLGAVVSTLGTLGPCCRRD